MSVKLSIMPDHEIERVSKGGCIDECLHHGLERVRKGGCIDECLAQVSATVLWRTHRWMFSKLSKTGFEPSKLFPYLSTHNTFEWNASIFVSSGNNQLSKILKVYLFIFSNVNKFQNTTVTLQEDTWVFSSTTCTASCISHCPLMPSSQIPVHIKRSYMKSWEVKKTIKEIDPFYSRWSKKFFHLIRWFESQQKI